MYPQNEGRNTGQVPTRLPAVDALCGETMNNLQQIRGALGIISSRIDPRPLPMGGDDGPQKPKEPSLIDMAKDLRDVSAECVKRVQELETMLFQNARGASTAGERVG